jgi:asparagine synthase (glutamine-hydrolysing)
MHRLSIMDVAHGWQPFWSEDGSIGILGNGEIYNAAELRQGLQARGHAFSTTSDMEVIPHAYEEKGLDFVLDLRGMFALAIIDRRRSLLLLVRDRLGEKPLCTFESGGAIYFASEQSALVRSGIAPLVIDREVLPSYLRHGYTPEPKSLIAGVEKVPAAHMLEIDTLSGARRLHRYWNDLSYLDSRPLSTVRLAAGLEDAVTATCTSDVPVGIALSGGLDSSMVAAIAARTRTDLHAFTIGYTGAAHDETEYAKALASDLGIPCHVTTLDTRQVASRFADVCRSRDEPISDIAGPSLAALPEAAHAKDVPVLLTGIGGDELFWGYEWIRHLAAWTTRYLATDQDLSLRDRLGFTPRPTTKQGFADWAMSLGGYRTQRDLVDFMQRWSRGNQAAIPFYEFQYGYRAIERAIRDLCPGSRPPEPEFFFDADPLKVSGVFTHASNETYLRVNSLVQMDRLSMHYSVESRTPLADATLVELVMSSRLGSDDVFLPPKIRLREVAASFLPQEVINRPKRGFTPPVREWLRAIWQSNGPALSGDRTAALCGIPVDVLRSQLASPLTRTGRVNQVSLRLMTLELWLRGLE